MNRTGSSATSFAKTPHHTVVIGAGPAGLTAAYELSRGGRKVTVVEQDPNLVGGIARTANYKGFRFDIGGHRFFSKNQQVEDLWTDILGDRMIVRDRLSRIYYRGRFFKYPLETRDVLANLGDLRVSRMHDELCRCAPAAAARYRHLRGLGHQRIRAKTLRDVLPQLHGEGVGHPVQSDQR